MMARSTRWRLAAMALGVLLLAPFWSSFVGLAPQPLPPPGRFVSVGGYRINVIDEGRGVPVVLVHGLPGSAYDWSPLPQQLLDAGFRVIRYDRVGYGYSDRRRADAEYRFDTNGDELAGLLSAIHAESPIVVGWSYGGGVVQRAAVSQPQTIAALLLVASVGPAVGTVPRVERTLEWPQRWAVASGFPARTIAWFIGRREFNGPPPEGWTAHAVAGIATAGVIHSWMMEAEHEDTSMLQPERITQPVTIVHGSDDVLVPLGVATDLHRRMPSSRMVWVPGGHHMLPNSHAALIVDEVRALAAGLPRLPRGPGLPPSSPLRWTRQSAKRGDG
jgi:pimeloyl-ACP methyl ester carboxylesterase